MICNKCSIDKSLSEFRAYYKKLFPSGQGKTYISKVCKACESRAKVERHKRKGGMSRDEWNRIQQEQAMQRVRDRQAVSHMVCNKCNSKKPVCDFPIARTVVRKYGRLIYRQKTCSKCINYATKLSRIDPATIRGKFDLLMFSSRWPGHIEEELSGFLRVYTES